jgi:hypothetical protein
VDFVDEEDLAGGALASRGYRVLYVTGPNIRRAAQSAIAAWVNGGGVLVTTPGAACRDEYNEPTTALDAVLGLSDRNPFRQGGQNDAVPPAGSLVVSDPRFGSGEADYHGPRQPLVPVGAAAAAVFREDGGPAVTVNDHGRGKGISFGFYPGWSYYASPDRYYRDRLPENWDRAARMYAAAPAAIAGVQKVASVTGAAAPVETVPMALGADRLVVLLSHANQDHESVTVTVPTGTGIAEVTSLMSGVRTITRSGGQVSFALPLGTVDVIRIRR